MKSPKTYLKDSFSEIWFQEMVLGGALACLLPSEAAALREALQPDSINLILCQPLLRPVIQLGCARALVSGHFLGVLQHTGIR
jgi:hypothetical protein